MAKGSLQVDPFLLPVPTDPLQFEVEAVSSSLQSSGSVGASLGGIWLEDSTA